MFKVSGNSLDLTSMRFDVPLLLISFDSLFWVTVSLFMAVGHNTAQTISFPKTYVWHGTVMELVRVTWAAN